MVLELTHLTSFQIMAKYQRMEKNGIKVGIKVLIRPLIS